jgi:hypothetical protein
MTAFIKTVAFATPGIIAIVLIVWGLYLFATPLFFGQPGETFSFFGIQVTALQAGLGVFVVGLAIALLSIVGSFNFRSPRSPGSHGAELAVPLDTDGRRSRKRYGPQ